MKNWTQEEVDAVQPDEFGWRNFPTGDYTQVKSFGERCSFGEQCSFGEWCRFGMLCSFGEQCTFGEWCSFGKLSSFGKWCSFGKCCSFGDHCSLGKCCSFSERSGFGKWCGFGKQCSFGELSTFGEWCSFGIWCSFGEQCSFDTWCSFENGRITNGRYIAIDRIGSQKRKTYFFRGDEGLFVRAGCWFGNMEYFRERVKHVHGGTRHEREYLAACDLAEMMLDDQVILQGGEEMEKAYFSVKEAAQYLSANEDTLRGKLQAGIIPAYKIGKLWRIRKDELEKYLEENGNRNA